MKMLVLTRDVNIVLQSHLNQFEELKEQARISQEFLSSGENK